MGRPQNLHSSSFGQPPTQTIHAPTQPPPSLQGLPFPSPCPPHYSPRPFCFRQNHNGPRPIQSESRSSQPTAFDPAEHEQKVLDARATKAARNRRKMARQKYLNLHRKGGSLASSTANASSSNNGVISSKHPMDGKTLENGGREDLYTFLTPDGKVGKLNSTSNSAYSCKILWLFFVVGIFFFFCFVIRIALKWNCVLIGRN